MDMLAPKAKAVSAAPPPPSEDPVAAAARQAAEERTRQRNGGGRASTILTSPLGDTSMAPGAAAMLTRLGA